MLFAAGFGQAHLRKRFFICKKPKEYIDMVSETTYNAYADTVSEEEDDEGFCHEKSNTGADRGEKRRDRECL